MSLIKPLFDLTTFKSLLKALNKEEGSVLVTGIIESQKAHLVYGLYKKIKSPILIVTHSEVEAKNIYSDLSLFQEDIVRYYPSKDIVFYNADVKNLEIIIQRFKIINSLINNENIIIVTSVETLLDKICSKKLYKSNIITCGVGEKLELEVLKEKLVTLGYERRDIVEYPGQFAVRGGIVDIFLYTLESPVRIELWGDEIDSIRMLNLSTQRSVKNIEEVVITPVKEVIYTEEVIKNARESIMQEYQKLYAKHMKNKNEEIAENLKVNITKLLELLEEETYSSKLDRYISYFYNDPSSILDYMPKKATIIVDEPRRVKEHANFIIDEFIGSIKRRIETGDALPSQSNLIFSYDDVINKISKYKNVLFSGLTYSIKDFKLKEIINFWVKPTTTLTDKLTLVLDDLKYYVKNKYKVVILAGTKIRGRYIEEELRLEGLNASYISKIEEVEMENSFIAITEGILIKGFEYPYINFVVLSCDAKSIVDKAIKKRKNKETVIIESFTDLKLGDYIVHENHGIGIYRGIEQITQNGINKDYLKLEYADGGNIYVSTTQLNFIQKYIGGETAKIKLNKLSSKEWIKTKSRVKKSVKVLAKDLIDLYAKRMNLDGYKFSEDTVWQSEFESMFPFEETYDQLEAIYKVKEDMESTKVMDRLICGDVGYGKTEIAIRAAFKCIYDEKQVAFLVPTTILAQQHYNNFMERMKDFNIKIGMLSRFVPLKQQKETFKEIATGECQIVIGTHKLFNKDLKFKDLGLIVIDEEQRFGVKHKETLKVMKENIDVLTLTATPIPRTLHMSLIGIRDMSLLEEPPLLRQSVQTYVIEYNEYFVKEAIIRELARGGQVYYVYNRVSNISEIAYKIQEIVPEARVSCAHGQMNERELENIMLEFISGKIDVLVCTTIVETGLDISNANTIIIQDAQRMGLSQLYQLRGRVGRSNRLAYAYLMYKKDKVLTEIAEKRLQTIRDFTELGSGFKISTRDLELRGAGNLLGGEQHGHMDTIGYEMYCKLLSEAIKEEKGEGIQISLETTIDINVSAYIPKEYIENEEQKLIIYKKISEINSKEDYYDVQEEIEDRYGTIPIYVQNLLEIVLLKSYANKLYMSSVKEINNSVEFIFIKDSQINVEGLVKCITTNKNVRFVTNKVNKIIYDIDKNKKLNIKELIEFLKELIEEIVV